MTETSRKQDTRDKIQLGGLIVKAGLREADKALLFGILLSAKEALSKPDSAALQEYYTKLGKDNF